MRTLRRALGIVLLLMASASTATAGSSEADRLFEEGRVAVKAGDYATGLARFEASQKLDPAPGTLLNIAECEEKLGKLVVAWTHFQQIIQQLPPKDERVPVAKQRVDGLSARIPRLRVTLAPGAPPSSKILQDDVELPGSLLGVEQPLDPGRHVVVVSAEGRPRRQYRVDLAEGEHKSIPVEPGDAEPAAPAVVAAPPPKPVQPSPTSTVSEPQDKPRPSDTRSGVPLGYIVGGAGIVSLGVGAVTGAMALGKKVTISAHCDDTKACDGEGIDAVSSAKTLSTVSTVAFAVGAIGVGTGLYIVLTQREDSRSSGETGLWFTALPAGGSVSYGRAF